MSEGILMRPQIPGEDAPVVVDVRDVSMVFNMASEQLNSLKEYFIKLVRHELFFKEFHALDHVSFQVRRLQELPGLASWRVVSTSRSSCRASTLRRTLTRR